MYPQYLSNYVVNEFQSLAEGYWKLKRQSFSLSNTILIVLDNENHYIGVMTMGDFNKCMYIEESISKTTGEFCNRDGKYCRHSSESRIEALIMFANEPNIDALPVIDDSGNLIDIIFRQQVFYKEFFKKGELPRMNYAKQIYDAAKLAKALNYTAISVIEFGVAGGRGLVNCEFHAREISKLFDIDIEVYGFDTGTGLPDSNDYRDNLNLWYSGQFPMNIELLQKRLQFAKLIIGDIKETCENFLKSKSFAPIGTMLIDVDYYTSTIPILNMLLSDTKNFLPRIYMYFDDTGGYVEHIGELRAIAEFNGYSKNVKISRLQMHHSKLFCGHLFNHEKYNTNVKGSTPFQQLVLI